MMNISLWIMQLVLSVFFLITGFGKISNTKQQHIENGHIKPGDLVTPIWILGILEILGSVGITIPWLTGIAPVLTPVTAICFCLIMAGAFIVHLRKREYKFLPLPVLIIVLTLIIAYYRFKAVT